MSGEIGLFDAMYTQRAIRRLKPDPIPDDLIHKLIESATKAPSGTNRQPWKFIVVKDQVIKSNIAHYYKKTFDLVYGDKSSSPRPISSSMMKTGAHLAEHIQEAPIFIIVCALHDGSPSSMDRGASIFPAVQNLLLTARGLGLGGVLTNNHKRYEDEVKQILKIPANVETAALVPIGYPDEGASYGPTRRSAVEEVTYWDTWGSVKPFR